MPINVGICGASMPKQKLAEMFDVAEVQQTFYEPPKPETLAKWLAETPQPFEYTVKAWQLITHSGKSPTYRRLKRTLTDVERGEVGAFRETAIVEEGWRRTRESAEALNAKRILFQCPASFTPTSENLENLMQFFTHEDRVKGSRKFIFMFEPRGDAWTGELLVDLCSELNLVHVVDPFARQTVTHMHPYYRLHGRGGYSYVYDDAELDDLQELVEGTDAYVMFNNVKMRQDAMRFKEMLGGDSTSV
jgi:uncharacterized protein YecE (DUF72 family)